MKKKKLFISTMLISITGLNSCLIDGGNKQSASAYGVLRYNDYSSLCLYSTFVDPVSSPQLSQLVSEGKMQPNFCYTFNFEIDYDRPENTRATLLSNGYYTVTINDYTQLPTFYVNPHLTDTTAAMENEIPVSNGYVSAAYAAEYIYIQQTVNQPSDAQLNWDISFEYASITNPKVESGIRYYDLFVRAQTLTEGTKSNTDVSHLNAFYMSNFFNLVAQNEKTQLGANYSSTSTFKFRIFYVKEIKDGVLTWHSSLPQEAYISAFTENY
ncbi:MAG: hypothetical protein LBD80_00390 [Tannerella sp.]|jgi:hypothetical protein|nr:hypothetical protein [Tannerella sp.]